MTESEKDMLIRNLQFEVKDYRFKMQRVSTIWAIWNRKQLPSKVAMFQIGDMLQAECQTASRQAEEVHVSKPTSTKIIYAEHRCGAYKCQQCGTHFNSDVLACCPNCGTKVGEAKIVAVDAEETKA